MSDELMNSVEKILFDALVEINDDRLKVEMEDFKTIEQGFIDNADPISESASEIWILVESEDQPDEGFALGVKLIAEYPDPYIAFSDDDLINECKKQGAVGIVLRCEAWASESAPATGKRPSESDDRKSTLITCLCTGAGVHVIARCGDEVFSQSESRVKSFNSENKLVRAIASACYTW